MTEKIPPDDPHDEQKSDATRAEKKHALAKVLENWKGIAAAGGIAAGTVLGGVELEKKMEHEAPPEAARIESSESDLTHFSFSAPPKAETPHVGLDFQAPVETREQYLARLKDVHAPNFPDRAAPERAPAAAPLPRVETPAPPRANPVEKPAPPETHAKPEIVRPFMNLNGVLIDASKSHVYEDASHALFVYGADYEGRVSAAQEYVRAHHDAIVSVEANQPVFYNGAERPWVFKVSWGQDASGGKIEMVIPANDRVDPAQIGGVNPDAFTAQRDGP